MPYRWLVAKDVSMPLTGAQQRPSAKRGLSATEKNTTAPGWEETELMVRRPLAGADRSCWEEGWLEVQRRRLHLAARQSWKKVTREGSKDHHSTTAAATVLTQAAAKMRVYQMMKTMAYADRREEGWLLMKKIIATKGAAETVMVVLLVVEEKKRWRWDDVVDHRGEGAAEIRRRWCCWWWIKMVTKARRSRWRWWWQPWLLCKWKKRWVEEKLMKVLVGFTAAGEGEGICAENKKEMGT